MHQIVRAHRINDAPDGCGGKGTVPIDPGDIVHDLTDLCRPTFTLVRLPHRPNISARQGLMKVEAVDFLLQAAQCLIGGHNEIRTLLFVGKIKIRTHEMSRIQHEAAIGVLRSGY